MNQPQKTDVMLVRQADGLWRIMLAYEDGSRFISDITWTTEEEAGRAADRWVMENAIPGRLN